MKTQAILIILLSILSLPISAQNVTLSGYIRDKNSGEDLICASVYVDELQTGTITNFYGFYSLTIPEGNYNIKFSYIGFENHTINISLYDDKTLTVELLENAVNLSEIVVKATKEDENITSVQMGVEKIAMKEIETIPVLFGEKDVMKTIQLLPGISSAGEGSSGFNVRGGSADQNLILLDEAPVYSASHMMGFFSIFNSDAIKDLQVYKGTAPANYGGRLSSVVDVKTDDGNSKEMEISGGIGLISSRLTVEVPVVKNKASFTVSGRRTYADWILKSLTEDFDSDELFFYDINAKGNYKINDKNRIYISGYLGRDVFDYGDFLKFDYGNKTTTIRYNHLWNNKLFSNSTLIYSDYNYMAELSSMAQISSEVEDFNFKTDYQYYINSNNDIKFGVNAINHTFTPGKINLIDNEDFKDIDKTKYAIEGAAYISHSTKINQHYELEYGLRYSSFSQMGSGDIYNFDIAGNVTDTVFYSRNQSVKYYGGFEPRISGVYKINNSSSIKMGYTRNRQYVHLLTNSTSGTPFDIYLPSTNYIQPLIADQITLGYFQNFDDNMFESSVEIYYKNMQNLIDYKDGADVILNPVIETQIVFGSGYSYGAEFFVKKTKGDLTGWISYTLSNSMRQFDEINSGNTFPSMQDKTHDLSIVCSYKPSKNLTFSGTWVYYTGNAVTFPSAKYVVNGQTISYYTERNGYRMPDYHRLDLCMTYEFNTKGKYESSLNISIYNVYARQNAYTIKFEQVPENPTQTQAVQLSLFSIVPTITYNFRF